MKFILSINQKRAIELGIKNAQQAIILGLLCECSTWAKPILIEEEVYYWAARQEIARELPLLDLSPDSVYRHLKNLKLLGLIDYEKSGKRDVIRLTELGKSYYVGKKSEDTQNAGSSMSEKFPSKLGKKSEKSSEIFPTDQYTISYPETILPFREIIKHLNETVQSNFKDTERTKSLITDRWSEGYRLDDFKHVHEIKRDEWEEDEQMSKYLRPETLYGAKFESYRNQKYKSKPLILPDGINIFDIIGRD